MTTSSQNEKKRRAAEAALEYLEDDMFIGVGTGSTANYFIDLLAERKARINGTVASSEASAAQLRAHGIPVLELNGAPPLDIYIDGADEATRQRALLKGGGGALTREKIVAQASSRFICIVDDSKLVAELGTFPLPVEVIPMARSLVARELVGLGGVPEWREGFVTDNGNWILDVHGLAIENPQEVESQINQLPGVVANGLFARRRADVLLVATETNVTVID